MPQNLYLNKIDPVKAIYAVNGTLRRIDERIVDHGERVGYIACKICEAGGIEVDKKILFLLCAFHDIGAYKTEEIDRMFEFETQNVQNHSIYGYLFLKYMTPLEEYAEAILYHHSSWDKIEKSNIQYGEYAELIHLADRIDVAMTYSTKSDSLFGLLEKSKNLFRKEYYDIAKKCLEEGSIIPSLKDGSYHEKNLELCSSFISSAQEALAYLKMVVYSIDFRSDHTVTHTINTVAIALNIARYLHMNEEELKDIYLGALLHDIGKIAIPLEILESPGKLNDEEMTIMRTHVDETEKIIKGIVPDKICLIALRHHEKLDGMGYPKGITGADLTISERIVAIADIVSALSSRRSYKEPFPKEKTISILKQMSEKQLDPDICKYVLENYDQIMEETDESRILVINRYQNIKDEYEKMINP